MEGGVKNNEPLIIVKNNDKNFLEEMSQKRIELISSIVYRVLSNEG